MHTSQALRSSHFQYRRIHADGCQPVPFSSFCASYHEQDRVGVVSSRLEDGVLHTSYALLALTTAFYDRQRARGGEFFIYPQHLAIIGADRNGVATGAGDLDLAPEEDGVGAAWSWLDVWPAANWLTAPAAPDAMLRKAFDHHVNRLFWPQDLLPEPGSRNRTGGLPDYARRILQSRLKSVYYYNTEAPTLEIHAAQPAVDILAASVERLPPAVRRTLHRFNPTCRQQFRHVSVDDFLHDVEPCFAA